MKIRTSVACAALAVAVGLSFAPVAQAMDDGAAMMHKTAMKKHMKKKGGMMMKGDAMKGDAMSKDPAPAQ